jgi:hypothetical protein
MMICHAIERTSPKGGPFLGTCMRCGRTGLPMSAVTEPCENVAGMTDDEVLLTAIKLPCTHRHWDQARHGRYCDCGVLMVDPGD